MTKGTVNGMNNHTRLVSCRVSPELDAVFRKLTKVHNANGEVPWTKSDTLRFVLDRGVEIVRKETGAGRNANL